MRNLLVKGFVYVAFIALSGVAGACSCGDDGGDGDGDGDGDADAAVDGMEVTATRSGTIALTQIAVVDTTLANIPAGMGGPIDLDGAAFTVAYDDLTTLGVAPSYTDGDVGCTVFEFDGSGGAGTDNEAAEVDEGPVVITNFAGIGDIACAFVDADTGYQCAPANPTGTVGAMSAVVANAGSATVTVMGADFTMVGDSGATGMTITFPDGTWTNPENDGTFPIIAVNAANVITIGNPDAVGETIMNASEDYAVTVGNGPVPAGIGSYDMYAGGNMTNQFSIAGGQESGGAIDTYDDNITPASLTAGMDGDGITLNVRETNANGDDVAPFDLENFPTTEVTIGCDIEADNNNCTDGAPISALIVSGRTTDGTLPTTGNPVVDETTMPDPVGTYTTFTCVFLGQKTGTISQGAIDAIRAGSPTRIETRVIYAGGKINTEADMDRVNLLAGYAVIGWDDDPLN